MKSAIASLQAAADHCQKSANQLNDALNTCNACEAILITESMQEIMLQKHRIELLLGAIAKGDEGK